MTQQRLATLSTILIFCSTRSTPMPVPAAILSRISPIRSTIGGWIPSWQQDLGCADQCARNRQLLLLSAAHCAGLLLELRAQHRKIADHSAAPGRSADASAWSCPHHCDRSTRLFLPAPMSWRRHRAPCRRHSRNRCWTPVASLTATKPRGLRRSSAARLR